MKYDKVLYKKGYTKDGYLTSNQGRIVIYQNFITTSKSNSQDHLYILRALAAQNKLNVDEVISKAIRLYFTLENNTIIVSQNRKIDEDMLFNDPKFYARLILNSFN